MKKLIIFIGAILIVVCTTYAQEAKYVKVDDGVANSVIESVLKKADFENDKERVYSKNLMEDAFEKYFNHKKLQEKVFTQDTITRMHKTVRQLNERLSKTEKNQESQKEQIAKLEQQLEKYDSICKVVKSLERSLQDSSKLIKACQQKIVEQHLQLSEQSRNDSVTMITEIERYRVAHDSIAEANKVMAAKLTALQQANDSLGKMTRYFATVQTRKAEMETNISGIYRNCREASLCGGETDWDGYVVKVQTYKSLIDALGVPCEKDMDDQCAFIMAMKDISTLADKVLASMKGKYDETVNKQLLVEVEQLSVEMLTDEQKKEWEALAEALKYFPNVSRNFRNGILEDLKSLACIPNDDAKKLGLEYIDGNVRMFFNYSSKEGVWYYGPYYEHLNKLTDRLRDDLNANKKNQFGDEKVFETYLKELANEV